MVNKVTLIGYLGGNPDVRFTGSDTAVTNLRLCTTDIWNDLDGKRCERSDWHKVTCWGRLAEIAGEFLQAGDLIYVEGQLRYSKFKNKDKIMVKHSYVHGIRIKFLKIKGNPPQNIHEEMEGD